MRKGEAIRGGGRMGVGVEVGAGVGVSVGVGVGLGRVGAGGGGRAGMLYDYFWIFFWPKRLRL